MSASIVLSAIVALVGLAIVALIFNRLFAGLIYRGSQLEGDTAPGADASISPVEEVMQSGPIVATGMCGGSIGLVAFRGSLRVDVHLAGIVLKPMMMPVMALLREEIIAVQPVERLLTHGIEISHTSPRITASVHLVCAEESELSRALLALAPAGTTP